MAWRSPDKPSRFGAAKFAFIFIIILGIVTARGVTSQTIVSASTAPANAEITDQLNNLQNYVAVKDGFKPPLIYSKAYLLLDSDSAEVIVSKNAELSLPIASTTKMVTALVTLENLPLDKVVTVSTQPPQINGSKIGLRSNEQITVANLLKGLLIYSGNDAAMALAETYAGIPGDSAQIVDAMNNYVKAHRILETTFSDPAGLDDDTGRSTPRDLANIARLLLMEPTLAAIVSTPETTITSVNGQIIHPLKNTNRLIEAASTYYLPSALGVKTGYTPAAGHCLISAYTWHGRTLIGVVMNTTESTNSASAQEMYKLFRWAEGSLEMRNY